MKGLMVAFCALSFGWAMAADENAQKKFVRPQGETPLQAQMARGPRRHQRPNGGLVVKKIEGKIIAVRNRQTAFSPAVLQAVVDKVKMTTYLPVLLVGSDENRDDVGVEVVLLDHPARAGFTVMVAPEQNYAELALDWIFADAPDPERFSRRLYLALTRAVAMSLGCGVAVYQPDLMAYVHSVKDLDRIGSSSLGPEATNIANESARRLGVNQITVSSYRRACQQGWAPDPTNDVQRAIWKEVHALPTEPIVIKPESERKGK